MSRYQYGAADKIRYVINADQIDKSLSILTDMSNADNAAHPDIVNAGKEAVKNIDLARQYLGQAYAALDIVVYKERAAQ